MLASAFMPALAMTLAGLLVCRSSAGARALWRCFAWLAGVALAGAVVLLGWQWGLPTQAIDRGAASAWFATSPLTASLAVLVQFLGVVIGAFSSRYLEGEAGQRCYVAALCGVLAAVQLLLLANHWLPLIAAWVAVGAALQPLLCFYPERPFALLAAHKKRLADRLADLLLIGAAGLAWWSAGSGSFDDLYAHLADAQASALLSWSAVLLAGAVILRTALLPVHGWLIQVMEAPTPVSALLHAGVVNLGGIVLIRLAPLVEASTAARWILVVFGLGTAMLAGLVMLTRISIKVRLAWSTVAQMGFMVLECGLGLYTLAALHLIGHSLYKAHTFLAASTVVRQSRQRMMRAEARASLPSLLAAPWVALAMVAAAQTPFAASAWPLWWSGVLALAWSPLLWLPAAQANVPGVSLFRVLGGLGLIGGLTALAQLLHGLPLGLEDRPADAAGMVTLLGMVAMYLALLTLQWRPRWLEGARRWSYAGFYVDEFYTRLALRFWPAAWTPAAASAAAAPSGSRQ